MTSSDAEELQYDTLTDSSLATQESIVASFVRSGPSEKWHHRWNPHRRMRLVVSLTILAEYRQKLTPSFSPVSLQMMLLPLLHHLVYLLLCWLSSPWFCCLEE